MANKSVFQGAAVKAAGSMSGNKGGISGELGKTLGIVTNVQIQFQQQVSRIFDLNRANAPTGGEEAGIMYFVGGRASGNMTIGRIIGPSGEDKAAAEVCNFYQTYGNICDIASNISITFAGQGVSATNSGECNNSQETTFLIESPMITNMGISQNSQDTMVTENLQFQFADLVCNPTAGPA